MASVDQALDTANHLARECDSLRREVERLTRERDAAYAASQRSDEVHAEAMRAVRARAEKAEAERDEAVMHGKVVAKAADRHREHEKRQDEMLRTALRALTAARAQVERLRVALDGLVDHVSSAGPTGWAAAVDLAGAATWEREAEPLLRAARAALADAKEDEHG